LENTCKQLLDYCLRGEAWPLDLLDRAVAVDEGRALLSVVVERLGDLFEPRLAETYTQLFTQVIERVAPGLKRRIRSKPACAIAPDHASRVYVLSRVTLGADVAVTSVLLNAAKHRYPEAEIVFVGPQKSYDLFAADARIRHFPAPYARSGALKDRLAASANLWVDDGVVIDPDSRLSQLGVISVCPETNYFLFPSRSYGGNGKERLPDLAARWAEETFGMAGSHPFIAPLPSQEPEADITVSLGVGENFDKRVDDAFERGLLRMLHESGASVLVDKGGSAEERARVERALLPGMRTHNGAFAPFAAMVARSRLFVGYDSAGGHVASACGVPLISIAKGFISERMAERWRPHGTVLDGNAADILEQVRRALATYTFRR
jgi:hypothetical protein